MASPVIDTDDIPSISYHENGYQEFDNNILDNYSNIDNPIVIDSVDERDESRSKYFIHAGRGAIYYMAPLPVI